MKRFFVSIFLLITAASATAQEEIPLVISIVDADVMPFAFRKYERPVFPEELQVRASELRDDLWTAGYASASIDSTFKRGDTAHIVLYLGQAYRITALTLPDDLDASSIGLRKNWLNNTSLSSEWLNGVRKRVVSDLEDNGYPYASATFTQPILEDESIQLNLDVDKGPLIRFDTISNVRQAPISLSYLSVYTGIKKGKLYSESLVKQIDSKLAELPFVRIAQPSRLWFSDDGKAHVEVFLDKRPVSRFDFLIGVLPNNEETGKVLVTGEAGVSLWNIFGTGKKIDIGWKRLQPRSQQLRVYFDYPYILGTPLGADVSFFLDKQDTTYLDLDWSLGVNYLFSGNDRVKIVVHNTQTFLQNPDTIFVRQNGKLPNTLDQSTLLTGLELYFERLDYLFNPSRGWEIGATVTAGFRKIRENNAILEVELPGGDVTTQTLYDSLGERSAKLNVAWTLNYYAPLASRHVLLIGTTGGALYNKQLLSNELHKIGGNALLRGFDEESILSSLYNIATLEYRYLLDRNAYLSLFFDAAYTEQRLSDSFDNDFPIGFGAGLNFETKAGIFGLSYAIGRQNGNPIDFRSSKIHFGYVNIF